MIITLIVRKRGTYKIIRGKMTLGKISALHVGINRKNPCMYVHPKKGDYGKAGWVVRDENNFCKYLLLNFGPGDYSIAVVSPMGKRGLARFWDGIITPTSYIRRVNARDDLNFVESFFSRYIKPNRPGKEYTFA